MTNLELAVAFTLKAEGKFVIDDGGPTMYGVTQHVYDSYRTGKGLPTRTVADIEMPEVLDIMESRYWEPASCDKLSTGLSIAMFDWAYNHGAQGAIETLQGCLGLIQDGDFGPKTLAAVNNADDILLSEFLDARREWYNNAANEHPDKYAQYLHGWLNRVDNLEAYIKTVV